MISAPTKDNQPLLFQCWATVYDGGPALKQHWVNNRVFCAMITSRVVDCRPTPQGSPMHGQQDNPMPI